MAVSTVRPQYLHHNLSEDVIHWFDVQFPPLRFTAVCRLGEEK